MIIYQIEIETRAGLNKGQPFRRLVTKVADDQGVPIIGKTALIDQDSTEYRQAQANVASRMKGDVCICGHIGFGYFLLAALNNLQVTSVTIDRLPNSEIEKESLHFVKKHHKYKGLSKADEDRTSFDRNDVKQAYNRILRYKQGPKKRIGKFI